MATAADGTQQQAGGQVSAAVAAFKAMEGKETMKLENVRERVRAVLPSHSILTTTTDIQERLPD